ncbi:YlaH-like family protein [Tuberibacillus calidus]|uniref:YlaH-like family protein n=1 Tax=Tuberibacillus calidus TaxID=340097 RepID=UPI0003FC6E84|nr:YlaH-like family protein [Tuberibacillus calidus]
MNSDQIHFSGFPEFLVNHPLTSDHAIPILYFTIVVLSIIVYKLGFAKKLPLLKALIIYVFLLIGCIILTVLALQLPIVGALFVSAIVLTIYKIRLWWSKKKKQNEISKEA